MEPISIKPKRRLTVVTFRELVDGIEGFLNLHGYFYKSISIDVSPGDREFFNSASSRVTLHGTNHYGIELAFGRLSYELEGFAVRNLESKVGPGPFLVEIRRITVDPAHSLLFGVRIDVQPDRSMNFTVLAQASDPSPDTASVLAEVEAKMKSPKPLPVSCPVCHAHLKDSLASGRCRVCGWVAT